MKLQLKKKHLKSLSKDKKSLPVEMTKHIAGAARFSEDSCACIPTDRHQFLD
ncbi:hypothetical protein SG34_005620 [Thalassomonas viridans]|uniref:Uncharacterized protein n=1 Tax=Thalassomonas viridans TaxID=137584 RepID=A0AAE9Z4B0_9GAMM|nr:hypothetical protein [Thalassomonas viridans]WDE06400.1 hypothetical protein SG34_005620 [Thalassomonas viridans]